jgi:hypothetical protein
MELIVASGAPGTSWAGPSGKDLTSTVTKELKNRFSTNPSETFTAASLYNGILRKTVRKSYGSVPPCANCTKQNVRPYNYPTPIYFNLNEAVGATSICIKSLEREPQAPSANLKGSVRISQGNNPNNTTPREGKRRSHQLPKAREGEGE